MEVSTLYGDLMETQRELIRIQLPFGEFWKATMWNYGGWIKRDMVMFIGFPTIIRDEYGLYNIQLRQLPSSDGQ